MRGLSFGLTERKDLNDFDWRYNPKLPKRDILELATLKFIEQREGALLIGPPDVGKSHVAKAIAQLAVQRGYKVFYREAHALIEEINEARELGELRKYRAQLKSAELLVIDDLFLRKLPANAGDELADVLMSRYEKLYAHHVQSHDRGLAKAPWRCRRGDAASRSTDAPRALAEVRRQELAAEGSGRASCQARGQRVIIPPVLPLISGGI